MTENEISKVILDSSIEVHRGLGGPGLLESVYQGALALELESRGLKVRKEVVVPVSYKGRQVGDPLRLDLLVEDKVIVECKATEKANPIFYAQVLTYLRLTNLKLGLLVNFGFEKVITGFKRIANGLDE